MNDNFGMITTITSQWCTVDCKFYDEMNLMKIQYLIWKYLTEVFVPSFCKNNNLWFFTDNTRDYHQMWFLFFEKMRNSETKYKCQIRAGWLKLFVLILDLAMSTWYSGQCRGLFTPLYLHSLARQHCNAFCSSILTPERERETPL